MTELSPILAVTEDRDAEHEAVAVAAGIARASRRKLLLEKILAWVIRLGSVAILLAVWQVVAEHGWINAGFIGEPTKIWAAFVGLFSTSIVTTDLKTTMVETLIGFAISVVLGLLAGYAMHRSRLLYRAFHPLVTAANSVPRIALIPVFIIWFGLGPASKVANVVSFVFFIVLMNSLAAFGSTDRDLLLLARTLGFSERQRMRKFVLPGAVPLLAVTVELALIYSFLGAVIGEIIGGYNGLGVELERDANELNTDQFFAILLLIVIVVTVLVQGMHQIRLRLVRWSEAEMRGE